MKLTHFDEYGKATMVDVTCKKDTLRTATAQGHIKVSRTVYEAIKNGTSSKGDVLGVATAAAIMAVKKTWEIIPLCHQIPIGNCKVEFTPDEEDLKIVCTCTVKTTGKTGAEMEALTGVSAGLLTVYDMCKALDKTMEIGGIFLKCKSGGKSGDVINEREEEFGVHRAARISESASVCDTGQHLDSAGQEKAALPFKTAVIVLSDKGAAGLRADESGPVAKELLEATGLYAVERTDIIPDEPEQLKDLLIRLSDVDGYDLIITSGGTGLSPRDYTPEATLAVADRVITGISEYMRAKSFEITPKAMLSGGVSVLRGQTLIINLPGSPKAVRENLGFILPALKHGLEIMTGRSGECGSR